jgi:hypothetical protein
MRVIIATFAGCIALAAAVSIQAAPFFLAKSTPAEFGADPRIELVRDGCGYAHHRPRGKMAGVAGIGVDAFRTGGEGARFSSTVKELAVGPRRCRGCAFPRLGLAIGRAPPSWLESGAVTDEVRAGPADYARQCHSGRRPPDRVVLGLPAPGRARSRRVLRAEMPVLDWRERLVCSQCGRQVRGLVLRRLP